MFNKATYDFILQVVPKENVLLGESLNRHTTFKVGGEAEIFVRISCKEELMRLIPYFKLVGQDFFVLGNGSNLLVADRGYQGVILQIGDAMNGITVEGNKMIVQAGALLSEAAKCAMENSLTGLEFASGIPGTIGGGVVMNAGAYDSEMQQVVESVLVMNGAAELMELNNDTMEFGYRTSVIKNRAYVVLEVKLSLAAGNQEEIKARMNELAISRKKKQPLEFPSAGSTFKRPDGHFTGKLIMEAGLRGYGIGGAGVSEKHCGFIVNTGNATAADIMEVIEEVQDRVYERFGVKLEPEVICLGDF